MLTRTWGLGTSGWATEGRSAGGKRPPLGRGRVGKGDSAVLGTKESGFAALRSLKGWAGVCAECASIVDSFSYGFRTLVVGDCCGDQDEVAHATAMRDVGRRYADIIESSSAIGVLAGLARRQVT